MAAVVLCELMRGNEQGHEVLPRVDEALKELRDLTLGRRVPTEQRGALFAELRSLGVSYARIAECAADTPDNVSRAVQRHERGLARRSS
jgi:hypothetical protein